MDELERIWKESSLTRTLHFQYICLKEVKETMKTIRTVHRAAKIRTEHLCNRDLSLDHLVLWHRLYQINIFFRRLFIDTFSILTVATVCGVHRQNFDFHQEQEVFRRYYVKSSFGPAQPRMQWVLGAVSSGEKRPWREAGQSSPSVIWMNSSEAVP
jgi:hypothetical protein